MAALLGRLEDQPHRTGQLLFAAGQVGGGGEQAGGMAIMAACVHAAGDGAGPGQAGQLGEGQGVEVGAQGDAPAGSGGAEVGQGAGAGAGAPGDAQAVELIAHHPGGALELVHQLGVAVEIVAQGDGMAGEAGELVHGAS